MIHDQEFLSKIVCDENLDYDCIYFNGWYVFDYWGCDRKELNALFQFHSNKIVIVRNMNVVYHQKLIGIFQK